MPYKQQIQDTNLQLALFFYSDAVSPFVGLAWGLTIFILLLEEM